MYCIDKQIREILTNIDRTTMDTVRTEQFIGDADAIINSKLSRRYTVPFSPVPPLITTISRNIAAFFVMRTIFTEGQNKSDWTLQLYNDGMDILQGLADKKQDLQYADGSTVPEKDAATKVYSKVKNYAPIFELDDPLNHAVSQTRLDDIAEMRANS